MILVHKKWNLVLLKQHKDDEGRIICVEAKINRVKVNLCNVYAPNKEEPEFYHKVNKMLGEIEGGLYIIAGDHNQVQDGILDKTTPSTHVPRDRKAIHLMMKDLDLVDIWRLTNPREKEFTFYSHNHKSFSRIDYFLLSNALTDGVTECTIGPIIISDHAAVHLCMTIGTDVVKKSRWRLNTSLLHDQVFANSIEEDLKRFFEVNVGSVERMGTVWEASKAFIRGKIIAYSSKKKRKYREKLLKLEAQLKEKEMDLVENLTEILLKKVEYALFRLNSNFYESGDKAGKLLARQLQQKV